MIAGCLLALAVLGASPATITLATAKGELVLPVRSDNSGAPVVYASPVVLALGGSLKVSGAWVDITLSGQPLRLLIGAPFYVRNSHVRPSCAAAGYAVRAALLRGGGAPAPLLGALPLGRRERAPHRDRLEAAA